MFRLTKGTYAYHAAVTYPFILLIEVFCLVMWVLVPHAGDWPAGLIVAPASQIPTHILTWFIMKDKHNPNRELE